jgi:hypothetical protein
MSNLNVPFNITILQLDESNIGTIKPVRSLDIFDGATKNFHEDGLILSSDLSVSDPSGRFTVGFLGGSNTRGSYKELSQYIIYTHGRFQIKAIDTYNFSPGATYNNKEFFNYKPDETGRFIDLMLNYTGDRKFPLELSLSTLVYGI